MFKNFPALSIDHDDSDEAKDIIAEYCYEAFTVASTDLSIEKCKGNA